MKNEYLFIECLWSSTDGGRKVGPSDEKSGCRNVGVTKCRGDEKSGDEKSLG